jgi:hypothetical protein
MKLIPAPKNKKGPIIKIPKDMTPKPIKGRNLEKPYPMPGPIKGKPGKDKPYKMPQILPDKPGAKKPTLSLGGGNMSKYTTIKKTKQVNKIYKTY